MTSSQNGWPGLVPGSRLLHTWTVPGDGSHLILRQGVPGFLLIHFATRFDRRVEDLRDPILDDWGWAFRAIRGFAVLSNHASGTAMDLNATKHPMGVANTFSRDDQQTILRLLKKYDGALRWGGTYRTRKDDMHIEVDKKRPEILLLARDLAQTPRGQEVLKANPGQERIIMGRR